MTIEAIGKDLNDISGLAENASSRVVSAIKTAAQKTGVNFSYLMQKAQTESGMNPAAKAKGSSATGLFQFVGQTWLDTLDKHAAEMGRSDIADAIQHTSSGRAYIADPTKRQEIMDMRKDPELSACMAAALTQDNAGCLKAQLGSQAKVGGTELYLAHFLGAGGATDMLETMKADPNAPAASVVPQAAAANHNLFYTAGGRALSVQEVYNHFAAKFGDSSTPVIADSKTANMDVDATGDDAQAAATEMAMQSVLGSGHTKGTPTFASAFTGTNDNSGGSSSGSAAPVYQPVSSNMSADGKIYQFGANAPMDSHSMYFTMWLASQDATKAQAGI